MTDQNIKTLSTIKQSILVELESEKDTLEVRKKDYDDSVRTVDELTAMALNLGLTINIMQRREGPIPVNGEIAIPEYESAWWTTDR